MKTTFYVKVLKGKMNKEEVHYLFDEEVDAWHSAPSSGKSLHEFLGMPESVYDRIVEDPKELELIHNKSDLTNEELVAILNTLPPKAMVRYDSCCSLNADNVEYDEDFGYIVVNR